MLYERDKQLIEKLKLHGKGKYNQFTQGDIEYLIDTINACAQLEEKQD